MIIGAHETALHPASGAHSFARPLAIVPRRLPPGEKITAAWRFATAAPPVTHETNQATPAPRQTRATRSRGPGALGTALVDRPGRHRVRSAPRALLQVRARAQPHDSTSVTQPTP